MHDLFSKLFGRTGRATVNGREPSNFIEISGNCPVCDSETVFSSADEWLRDFFVCNNCGSIPRERALMSVIKTYLPEYRQCTIHESSPSQRGASQVLSTACEDYTSSYYYENVLPGKLHPATGVQCQNLEAMTFNDESFDLFVTQDVMEHVFDPEAAFKEISRVLRPAGMHIFTVPLVNKAASSERWASLNDEGEVIYHQPAEYHGNPISEQGALVTMHWGFDITDFIQKVSGISSTIIYIDDLSKGIRAEYIEVIVSRKQEAPPLGA